MLILFLTYFISFDLRTLNAKPRIKLGSIPAISQTVLKSSAVTPMEAKNQDCAECLASIASSGSDFAEGFVASRRA